MSYVQVGHLLRALFHKKGQRLYKHILNKKLRVQKRGGQWQRDVRSVSSPRYSVKVYSFLKAKSDVWVGKLVWQERPWWKMWFTQKWKSSVSFPWAVKAPWIKTSTCDQKIMSLRYHCLSKLLLERRNPLTTCNCPKNLSLCMKKGIRIMQREKGIMTRKIQKWKSD